MICKAVTNTEFKLKARPTLTYHVLCTKSTSPYNVGLHMALHWLLMVSALKGVTLPSLNTVYKRQCTILHGLQDVSITPYNAMWPLHCPRSSSDAVAQHQTPLVSLRGPTLCNAIKWAFSAIYSHNGRAASTAYFYPVCSPNYPEQKHFSAICGL